MRVGKQFQYANLEPDVKHSLVLSKYSHFTTLVIVDAHLQTRRDPSNIGLYSSKVLSNRWKNSSPILHSEVCKSTGIKNELSS